MEGAGLPLKAPGASGKGNKKKARRSEQRSSLDPFPCLPGFAHEIPAGHGEPVARVSIARTRNPSLGATADLRVCVRIGAPT